MSSTHDRNFRRKPAVRTLAQATLIKASVSGLSGLLAMPREIGSPRSPEAVVKVMPWQWTDPVSAILEFGGWTVEDAVCDPHVGKNFGRLWGIYKSSEALGAKRQRRQELEEVLWWGQQGCPVPCPCCGVSESCACV